MFAYGATGSGKTYTMVGQPNNPGCMARALNDLFAAMDNENNKSENIFKVINLNQFCVHDKLKENNKPWNFTCKINLVYYFLKGYIILFGDI